MHYDYNNSVYAYEKTRGKNLNANPVSTRRHPLTMCPLVTPDLRRTIFCSLTT